MLKKLGIWSTYFMVWEVLALWVNKPIFFPSFHDVIKAMVLDLSLVSFWFALGTTLLRVSLGTGFAFILALCLALMSYHSKQLSAWLNPLLLISKTIPNITYILVILIWFSRETSVFVISLLVVFPVLYQQIYTGLLSLHPDLLEVERLYPETWFNHISKVLIPMIQLDLREGLILALSLSFKVGVMAEILGQVQPGLGYLLYSAKVNFDTTQIFALTAWMICGVYAIEKGLRKWIKID